MAGGEVLRVPCRCGESWAISGAGTVLQKLNIDDGGVGHRRVLAVLAYLRLTHETVQSQALAVSCGPCFGLGLRLRMVAMPPLPG